MQFPSFTSLISQTWTVYKSNFKTLLKLCLLPYTAILVVLIEAVIAAVLYFVFQALLGQTVAIIVTAIVGLVMLIISMVLFGSWISASSILFIRNLVEKQPTGIKKTLTQTKSLIASVWWVGFLAMLVTFTGLMFFVIPGIVIGVWLSLVTWIVVLEKARGFEALKLSREYLRGYTLKVFLYSTAFSFLMGLITSLPATIFRNTNLESLIGIYSFVAQFLSYPLGFIFAYLIYKKLKSLKPKATEAAKAKPAIFYKIGAIAGVLLPILIVIAMIGLYRNLSRWNVLNQSPTAPVKQQNIDTGSV